MYHIAIEWFKKNKGVHKLSNIYAVSGISKQNHSQYMKRREEDADIEQLVVNSILEVRNIHIRMGIKKIYALLSPDWIGRDKFIRIGVYNGLVLQAPKNYARTTFSHKSNRFFNMLVNKPISDINKVWVSDITYIRIQDIFYYITLIMDVYSRRILGYSASKDLRAISSCRALELAIKSRMGHILSDLIHHSDRGVQYISNNYLEMLKDKCIGVSMCDSVYENTHIERVNGIIKNEYLIPLGIKSFKELETELKRAVKNYNETRPHWSLDCLPPIEYEEKLRTIPLPARKVMYMYTEENKVYQQQELFSREQSGY